MKETTPATTQRNYGADLLRILCMLMICVLHLLSYGGFLDAFSDSPALHWCIVALNVFCMCCVNCYALISGYFGNGQRKHAWGRLLSLWITVLFYSVLFSGIAFASGLLPFSPLALLQSFLPLTTNRYWFFSAYVVLFLAGPYLSRRVENTPQKQVRTLLLCFLILFSLARFPSLFFSVDPFALVSGRSPIWLCFVYTLGAYLKKYPLPKKFKPLPSFLLYVAFSAIAVAEKWIYSKISTHFGWGSSEIVDNTMIWVVLGAIFLFSAFSSLHIGKFGQGIVRFAAPLSFGVYLIHMHPLGVKLLRGQVNFFVERFAPALIPLLALLASFLLFLVCTAIDACRFWLFKLIRVPKFCKFLDDKLARITSDNK